MFKTIAIFALPTVVLFIFFLSLGENNQYSTENLTDRTIDNVENLVAMDLEKCANKVHPLKNENGFGSACK